MSLRVAARSLKPAFPRAAYQHARTVAHRQFASNAHNAPKSSDTAWMVGSALVFIPTIGYLLSPSARSKPHQAHSATGHGKPHAPAENTPTGAPPPPAEPTKTVVDAEGTEVSVEEVKASIVQAVTQDAPKEAAQAEVEPTKEDDSAPSQTSEAETDREQADKPHDEPKKGTLQDDSDAEPRPTELGKAQEQAIQGKAPKQAASNGGSK